MPDNPALRTSLHRLQYLLELARLEVSNIEETNASVAEEMHRRLQASFDFVHQTMTMAGPSGYHPGTSFEMCDTCKRWRLRKK